MGGMDGETGPNRTVVKPVAGILDLTSKTLEGIRNTTTAFDAKRERIRVPRSFGPDGEVCSRRLVLPRMLCVCLFVRSFARLLARCSFGLRPPLTEDCLPPMVVFVCS